MNPWENFRDEFKALMEEEDLIIQRRVPQACCYAQVAFSDSGEFSCWIVSKYN